MKSTGLCPKLCSSNRSNSRHLAAALSMATSTRGKNPTLLWSNRPRDIGEPRRNGNCQVCGPPRLKTATRSLWAWSNMGYRRLWIGALKRTSYRFTPAELSKKKCLPHGMWWSLRAYSQKWRDSKSSQPCWRRKSTRPLSSTGRISLPRTSRGSRVRNSERNKRRSVDRTCKRSRRITRGVLCPKRRASCSVV